MLHAEKEVIWWKHLFQKLGFDSDHDLIIYNDNLQTIRLLNSEMVKVDTKLRHIDIAQCWLRQEVQNGRLNVEYLSTFQMIADGLIKLLSFQKHKVFIAQLELVNLKKEILKA